MLNAAVVVLAVCALVVTGLVVKREVFPAPAGSTSTELATTEVSEWRRYAAVGQRIGPADARVVVVAIADFQCPFCRRLHEALQVVRGQYPNNVAIVYRHFPLASHPFAAQASECAAVQGRFEAYADVLYEKQSSIGVASWSDFAADAEVQDVDGFEACMRDGTYDYRLEEDAKAAQELGVTGTPTVLINDTRIAGAPPADQLNRLIQQALDSTD